ncbi:hypothetical protein DXG03_009717 [Asterophora parasitica]|uniref:CENP-V/GFA domain-containing protein n=1 Tax=Asterophora parasitica TaxID=117018 RepID=A0A9P7G432_9AGAR|nr:hypothetical protein DXG03_009717 [Asterophora parasitica]
MTSLNGASASVLDTPELLEQIFTQLLPLDADNKWDKAIYDNRGAFHLLRLSLQKLQKVIWFRLHVERLLQARVAITKGKEHMKVFGDTKTTTGKVLPRSFCSLCGSSLFLGEEKQTGIVIVPAGLVDEEVDWVPRKESFDHSRRNWIEVKTRPKPRAKL